MKKYWIIFLLFLTACSSKSEHAKPDKAKLDMLFRTLMLDNYFAYTLFGSKPVTYYGKFHESDYRSLIKPTKEDLFFSNWKEWKKLNVETPNYGFIEYDDGELFYLIFVNKQNTLNIIRKFYHIFEAHFERPILPEEILDHILNTKDYFSEFENNEVIYGLLFGFGYTNSRLYHLKYEKNYFYLDGVVFQDEPQHPLYILPLPNFMIYKSNDEVLELRKQYEEERKKIIDAFSKENFLETILEKLTT